MLLEIFLIGKRHALKCVCDECHQEFIELYYACRKKQYHFCSRACSNKSQKSGVLLEQVKATNLIKHGCEFPTQSNAVIEKQRTTNLERYGDVSTLRLGLKDFLEKNNVTNSSQLPSHKEKVKETSLRKYNTEHPFQSGVIKNKIIKTNLERHGCAYPMQSPVIKEKARSTNLKNHGGIWHTKTDKHRFKINWAFASVKRHLKMKQNGTYLKSSKKEDLFYETLTSIFDKDDVKRHVFALGYDIDFYITSQNVYVQFDGVYWHGLDREINEIKKLKNKRDYVILSTWKRDKRQNLLFQQHNKKLIRILETDSADVVRKKLTL